MSDGQLTRARAVIIDGGAVALIERHRGGQHYFVFPGGGVDEGESAEAAVVREAREEVGIAIEVGRLVAEVERRDVLQFFFLARVTGGAFGRGEGPEMRGEGRGEYRPVWIAIDRLPGMDVRLKEVAEMIVRSGARGWPEVPPRFVVDGRGQW
ncbi:MAG: NUDIX hydrolase [Thermomicrobiales bacterium]